MNLSPGTRLRGVKYVFMAILSALPFAGCGSAEQLTSDWNPSPALFTGNLRDWPSRPVPLKDSPVAISVRNDSVYFYMCLVSSNRDTRMQMLGAGMTVWLQPDGGGKLGVNFPLGVAGGGRQQPPGMDRGFSPEGGDLPQVSLAELDIIAKDERTRFPVVGSPGISVHLSAAGESVVYELKIPLKAAASRPYAIGATPGQNVRLTITTGGAGNGMPPPEGEGGPGDMGSGDMGPGGMGAGGGPPDAMGPPGGGGMGPGGPGGGKGPGGGFERPKQLSVKADITLAQGPAARGAQSSH